MEDPIFGADAMKNNPKIYNYGSKPKGNHGPFRVISDSTKKTYIGITSHNLKPGNQFFFYNLELATKALKNII